MPPAPPAPRRPRPPIRTIRERSTTTLAVPLSSVTRVSFAPSDSTSLMSRTLPMMPAAGHDLVALLEVAQQLGVLLPRLARGAQDQEVEHEADRRHLQQQDA